MEENWIHYVQKEAKNQLFPIDQSSSISVGRDLYNVPEVIFRAVFNVLYNQQQIVDGVSFSEEFDSVLDPFHWPDFPQEGDDYPEEWIRSHKSSSRGRAKVVIKILERQYQHMKGWEWKQFASLVQLYYDEIENQYMRWFNR